MLQPPAPSVRPSASAELHCTPFVTLGVVVVVAVVVVVVVIEEEGWNSLTVLPLLDEKVDGMDGD